MSALIEFDHTICSDLSEASKLEWLETNGIGGFASSSITGLNTRRYHGLLVAATKPPGARYVLLSKLEETFVLDGKRFELSANQYPGAVHPQGHLLLQSFRLDPFPVFNYRVEDIEIEKSVFMIHGENSVVLQYGISGDLAGRPTQLEIRPLIAFRDYHATTHANPVIRTDVATSAGVATITPYEGLPSLHFAHDAAAIEMQGFWCYNFEYDRERERGLDFMEDLHSPFLLRFTISQPGRATVIASTAAREATEAPILEDEEIERRERVSSTEPGHDVFAKALISAADQFVVSRGDQNSVIAGYHWFCDWGRDTMISLPGLTLVSGRFDIARNILRVFVHCMDQGMLPNRFPDAGEQPEYNTVDATLWMFHAVSEFLRYTGDYDFVRTEIYPALADSIAWHERGTRYGIRVDTDGLLQAGEQGVQLTWMDAKVGDWVVTPRQGKPVEIQALWYNALCVMEHLARVFDKPDQAAHYAALAAQARASFESVFWNEREGCLYDVLGPSGPDASIRPNQIFAVSLPHAVVEDDKARRIVDVVEWELLTPYGLRTLSPRDPSYKGRYAGDPRSRDAAYHQGTVWPWLLGPFLSAYLKVHGHDDAVRERAGRFLDPLRNHLWQAGLAQISEVFDGDVPHYPAGCIAQAWSVAEVLRAYIEDVKGQRPGSASRANSQ
ncbi:MAG TPA: amylo-alpha-1,6-glucosidase [Bryobacteraceae bacterium]|nr:amylo-alpha-1,6-glucosidase [Bryobacteraceae bacterium]